MDFVFYLLMTLFFTSATLSVIFLAAWRTMGRKPYILLWAITFAIAAVQRLSNILKETFPNPDLYWLFVCLLSVTTVTFGCLGHFQRMKVKVPNWFIFGSGAIALGLTAWYTFFQLHVGLKMSIYIFHNALFLLLVGYLLASYRKNTSIAEWGASISYLLLALFQIIAATLALLQGASSNEELMHWYLVINFTTLPAAFIAMGLFVVFILASDMAEKMKLLASTDSLTGCLNRRGFNDSIQQLNLHSEDTAKVAHLIYWDIDNFKQINDSYGHSAGDQVLIATTERIRANIKSEDLFGRMGGEEFVILIVDSDNQQTQQVAERLRKVIDETPIQLPERSIHVTISIGVANIEIRQFCIEQLLKKADEALYSAKESGKNRVVFAP